MDKWKYVARICIRYRVIANCLAKAHSFLMNILMKSTQLDFQSAPHIGAVSELQAASSQLRYYHINSPCLRAGSHRHGRLPSLGRGRLPEVHCCRCVGTAVRSRA